MQASFMQTGVRERWIFAVIAEEYFIEYFHHERQKPVERGERLVKVVFSKQQFSRDCEALPWRHQTCHHKRREAAGKDTW